MKLRQVTMKVEGTDPGDQPGLRKAISQVAGDDQMLFLDGFDDCIRGLCEIHGQVPRVAYDVDKILLALQERHGMGEEEAAEFYDHNIGCCYVGPYTPALILSTSIE